MPFTAEAKNGGDIWEMVDITRHDSPKNVFHGYQLRCPDPDCHSPMIIKHGLVVTPHFAHAPNSNTANCVFAGGGESEQHRVAKSEIAHKLKALKQYDGADIQMERIIRIDDTKRVADVYVEWDDGSAEVHEIQLSKTNIAECEERTNDYQRAGIDTVVWWFGGENASDSSLRQWAERNCGLVGMLHFEAEATYL